MNGFFRRLFASFDTARLYPVAAFALFPALTMRYRDVFVATDAAARWPTPEFSDTAAWWKAALVAGIAVWMLAQTALSSLGGRRPRMSPLFAATGLAAFGIALSALLSAFPVTAWLGYTSLYEGAIVLLSYLIALWYTAENVATRNERLALARLVGVVALIESAIGMGQGLGHDFWAGAAGRCIAGTAGMDIRFVFARERSAYGTVFQPNHFGMLTAMLGVLSIGMAMIEKKRRWRIFWIASSIGCLIAVFFSHSLAAFAAFAVGCGVLAVTRFRGTNMTVRMRRAVRLRTLFILIFLVAAVVVRPWDTLQTWFVKMRRSMAADGGPGVNLAVRLEGNRIYLEDGRGTVSLGLDAEGRWQAADAGGTPLAGFTRKEYANGRIEAFLSGRSDFILRQEANGNILLAVAGLRFDLFRAGSALFAVDALDRPHGRAAAADSVGFRGYERSFSGRGYIWSRGLALVRDAPWFGSGPDTFGLVFPNLDLAAKRRVFPAVYDIDKGHGIWLHFLVGTGFCGMGALLLVFALVVRAAWRSGDSMAVVVLAALAAYVVAGISIDSTPGVTPLFCVLSGLAASQSEATPHAEGVQTSRSQE